MENYEEIFREINREVTEDIPEVRQQFMSHFKKETHQFVEHMSKAILSWQELDRQIDKDKKKAYVAALAHNAINSLAISMKLLLSGYPVPAGNLNRQVIETLALAILCSDKSSNVLDRYIKDEYSANKALRDISRHADKLHINKDSVKTLKENHKFFDWYSHPTRLVLANQISLQGGAVYRGACFDESKLEGYRRDINGKLSLAAVFENFIEGIGTTLSEW